MDWLATLGMAMGSAWLSGINLYATVATLGILQRLQLARLPGDLSMLGEWWVIGLAGFFYLIEFIADKIPAVDSVWDAIHTFIRVPAGAVLAASAFADFDPAVKVAALLIGGSIALTSHGAKAATRLAANTSPEPVSNVALSLTEDGITIGSAVVMVFFPVLILIVVIIFVILAIWLIPKILRALRRLLARARNLLSRNAPVTTLVLALAFTLGATIQTSAGASAQAKAPAGGSGPRAAVQAFFNHLKAQEYDALYDFLPSPVQRQISREQITFSLKRLSSYLEVDRMEIGRVQQRGDYAVVDTTLYGRLKRPMKVEGQEVSEGRVAVQQLLMREGERWRVITADDRTRNLFLKSNPEFERGFQFKSPQFAFKQNGRWKPFVPGMGQR